MKRAILAWFVIANLFCFVTTFADLRLPWLPEVSTPESRERITEAGIMTQSALGGAVGSYTGLLLTRRLTLPDDAYLRLSMYLLMGQNAVAYALALALAWRLRVQRPQRGREIRDADRDIFSESSTYENCAG